jgi:hypothetical protein
LWRFVEVRKFGKLQRSVSMNGRCCQAGDVSHQPGSIG